MTKDDVKHTRGGNGGGTFVIEEDGKTVAELTYSMRGDVVVADHTFVDPSHRGGNFGTRLVDSLAAWARSENRKILPMCSYVRGTFDRKPEYQDVRQPL